jgi:hypothetical protein
MNSHLGTYRERIELLVSGDLTEPKKSSILQHLESCEACRSYYEALLQDDRRLDELTESMSQHLEKVQERLSSSLQFIEARPSPIVQFGRMVMRSTYLRVAASIIVIVAIIFILNLLSSPKISFSDWDMVYARMEQARSYSWRITLTENGRQTAIIRQYMSLSSGFRQEVYAGGVLVAESFYSSDDKELLTLMHRDKHYGVMRMNLEELCDTQQYQDIREFVKMILEFDHTNLGVKIMDGVRAAGVEVNDPKLYAGQFDTATGEMWVNVETGWPVRLEIRGHAAGGRIYQVLVMDEFRWEVDYDPGSFEGNIPDDYKLAFDSPIIDKDEESAIEGLRAFAELANGYYPSNLNINTAAFELRRIRNKNMRTVKERTLAFKLVSTCIFYKELVRKDREPLYFGEDVRAKDSDRVLMSWKLEDGNYRVVFGDLVTETVDIETYKMLVPIEE